MLKLNKKEFNKDIKVQVDKEIQWLDFYYIDNILNHRVGKFTQEEIDFVFSKRPKVGDELEIIEFRKYDISKVWYKGKNAEPIIINGKEVVFGAFWIEFKKGTKLCYIK